MIYRWHWFNVSRDDDLKSLREFIEKSKENGNIIESFPMFNLGYNNANFSSQDDALFFKWNKYSLSDFFKYGDAKLDVELGKRSDSPRDGQTRSKADAAIHDVIRSEWNLSASVLFDADGNGAIKRLGKKRGWEIDAAKLNAFLAHEKLRDAVYFSGLIYADCKRVPRDEVLKKCGRYFDAVCIEAKSSNAFKLGFDVGNGKGGSFNVSFGKERTNEGKLELWFDQENELLRYAHIEINEDKYNGVIPNPGLGEMISKVGGKIRGKMYFALEYRTDVMPVLKSTKR
jgi:hypothetical protein